MIAAIELTGYYAQLEALIDSRSLWSFRTAAEPASQTANTNMGRSPLALINKGSIPPIQDDCFEKSLAAKSLDIIKNRYDGVSDYLFVSFLRETK